MVFRSSGFRASKIGVIVKEFLLFRFEIFACPPGLEF